MKTLITSLCELFDRQLPDELNELDLLIFRSTKESAAAVEEDELESDFESYSDEDFDFDETENKSSEYLEGNSKIIAALANAESSSDLPGTSASSSSTIQYSPTASIRLQKEIKEYFLSDSFKRKVYKLELVNDSIYNWNVTLLQIDTDSPLYTDLKKLKDMGKQGDILLNINFPTNYPLAPPFVRVVEPMIDSKS